MTMYPQDPLSLLSSSPVPGARVWVPTVVFLNTPNTDTSLLDTRAAVTVSREGNYTMAPLDSLEQVSICMYQLILVMSPKLDTLKGSGK